MDGRYTWSLVAEVVRLTCGVDALADFMVLGGTGEVERSSTVLTFVRGAGCCVHQRRCKCGHWARAVARLVQVSAQPAPVRTRWG